MGFVAKKEKSEKVSGQYIRFKGKKYAFDLEEIKRICFSSNDQSGKEMEITEAFDTEEDGTLSMTSKICREIRSNGNSQNDMIIYDFVKLFIIRLLENTDNEAEFAMDFSTALAINTLIKWKLLIEIDE